MNLSLRNYSTAGAVLIALAAINLFLLHSPILGLAMILENLLSGAIIGGFALPRLSFGWRLGFGALTYGATKIILGTALYYLFDFGTASLLAVEFFPFLAVCAWWSRNPKELIDFPKWPRLQKPSPKDAVIGIAIFILDLAALSMVIGARTGAAIRSPWEAVPWQFFLIFFFASVGIFTLFIYRRGPRLLIPLAILHTFVGLTVALFVYQNGYGFDPFIHERAAKEIVDHGVVLPKTPYYIGQYVQVTAASRLTAFPLEIINRSVTPVISSIVIPLLLLALGGFAPLALFLPLPMFVLTTPQGTGYILLLVTAVAAALATLPVWMVWIFAVAAAAFHPIAGVPALTLAAFTVIARSGATKQSDAKRHPERMRRISGLLRFARKDILKWSVLLLLIVLAVATLPLAFWLNARSGSALEAQFVIPTLGDFFRAVPIPTFSIPEHYDLPLDLVYLWRWNIPLIVTALSIFGMYRAVAGKQKHLIPHLATAVAVIGSYVVVRGFFRFPGVISYEENIFSSRLLETAAIVLVPIMILALSDLLRRVRNHGSKVGVILLLASITTGDVYLFHPRIDRYEKNSGRSLSSSMIRAVQYLENQAEGNYIVLADQNAAAAQIKLFGFGPYYQGSYFYSHPSGVLPLYRFYQKMVEERPSRDIVNEAMDFAGVDSAYFIIHDYWKNFAAIVEEAKASADEWTAIDGGKVYIFRYSRTSAESLEM